MYWCIRDLWGPANLLASMVIELDDTLPRFTVVQWDSVRATYGLPVEVFTWKTSLGWGRTRSWLFDSHHKRWPLVLPLWLTCVVLSGYFPCKVYIDSNLCNTLRYGWSLLTEFKHRSCTDIMVVLRVLDDVDYFVVMTILFMYRWGSSSSFQRHQWGLSMGDPDRWGLGSLLGLA
jgi:hypothetical protein